MELVLDKCVMCSWIFAGYSHKPEEYSSIEDIANGVKVLAMTMAKLSLD